MDIQNSIDKAASLVRVVDEMITRFSADHHGKFTSSLQGLRRDVLRTLAGLYRGNILARFGLTALDEDIAVAVVIRDAATVQEYRYEDCYFRVVEPDPVIAEHLDTASHSRPVD